MWYPIMLEVGTILSTFFKSECQMVDWISFITEVDRDTITNRKLISWKLKVAHKTMYTQTLQNKNKQAKNYTMSKI